MSCRSAVSNFLRGEIEAIEAATGVRPIVNQLEYHPFVPESTAELVRWCKAQGIAVTAYGWLGGSSSKAGEGVPTAASASVAKVAERHGCTSAQVLLRWALSQGVAVIPGATSATHIRDNLNVPTFKLTASDLALLSAQAKPEAFTRWRNLSEEDRSWCKDCSK